MSFVFDCFLNLYIRSEDHKVVDVSALRLGLGLGLG